MLCNDLLTSCVTTTWVCKGYPLKRGGTASSPQSTPHEVPHGQAMRARVIQRKLCSPPLDSTALLPTPGSYHLSSLWAGVGLSCTMFPVLLKEWALKSAGTTIRLWPSCQLWFESQLSAQAQALNTWPSVGNTVLGGDGDERRWQALGTTDMLNSEASAAVALLTPSHPFHGSHHWSCVLQGWYIGSGEERWR